MNYSKQYKAGEWCL